MVVKRQTWSIRFVILAMATSQTNGFGIQPETVTSSRPITTVHYATKEQVGGETKVTKLPNQPPSNEDDPQWPVGALVERTLDTVEDIYLHLKRLPYEYGWLNPVPENAFDERETVVVLGTGWASHALLKTIDPYKIRVIVVSPSNHFVFTPMLASASVGTIEYRSMTEAIRACNPMIFNYLEGHAIDIDLKQKVLKVQMEELLEGLREGEAPVVDIPYDRLVVAVGCKTADSLVPGAREYALRLKTCYDARRLRTAVGESLEFANRPSVKDDPNFAEPEREMRRQIRKKRLTFAIVGGGPTGVELAGELADFIKDVTKPRVGVYANLKDEVSIVLLHGGKDLVPQFDEDLRKHAKSSLTKAGVQVRLNVRVNEVGDGFVTFTPKGEGQVQQTLDVGLSVFAAGTESVPFVKTLLNQLPSEAAGDRGKVNVDGWLRCPMPDDAEMGSILVMGDAASFQDGHESFLPETAQVAGQQGAFVARLLNRGYNFTAPVPRLLPGADFYLKLRGLDDATACKIDVICHCHDFSRPFANIEHLNSHLSEFGAFSLRGRR